MRSLVLILLCGIVSVFGGPLHGCGPISDWNTRSISKPNYDFTEFVKRHRMASLEDFHQYVNQPVVTIVLSTYYDENSIGDKCFPVIEQIFALLDSLEKKYPDTQIAFIRCPSKMCSYLNNSNSYQTVDYYRNGVHRGRFQEGLTVKKLVDKVDDLRINSETSTN